jgi:uncharacterized protein DUF2793
MNTPNAGIPYVPEGTLDPAAGLNDSLDVIDALLQTAVIDMTHTAPPGTPTDGDLYIVASPATGAWAGHEDDLARYRSEGAFWQFYTAGIQAKLVLNFDDLGLYKYNPDSPGGWTLAGGLGDAPVDGNTYARQDAGWVALELGMEVAQTDSPAASYPDIFSLVFGDGFTVTELTGGQVQIDGGGGSAESGRGTLTTLSIASNVVNMNHLLGADFDLQLTANVTTFNHLNVGSAMANWFTLRIHQDATGGRTFAVPASWKFGSGVSSYVVSSGASDIDLVQGVSYDDGATWMISYVKDYI